MTIRIARPTLAEHWRTILARLERRGVADAPAVARSLAVAAFTGRAGRRGEDLAVAGGRKAAGRRDRALVAR